MELERVVEFNEKSVKLDLRYYFASESVIFVAMPICRHCREQFVNNSDNFYNG